MKNLITFFLLMFISCSDDTQSPPATIDPLSYPHNTAHYSFYFTYYDSSSIRGIGDTLERHYTRILNDLNSDSLPRVRIYFYTNHAELAAAVAYVVPNLPVWANALALSEDEIHMMSPNHPDFGYSFMIVNLIHEFAHCVSYHIRPNIGNNPRWLWESVAIYESGQFFDPHNIPYLVSHNPPTLSQLNTFSNTMIYQVGYLLAEYIILNWSRTHFVNLILTNGNLLQVLGINSVEFMTGWFEFVMKRYGI